MAQHEIFRLVYTLRGTAVMLFKYHCGKLKDDSWSIYWPKDRGLVLLPKSMSLQQNYVLLTVTMDEENY